MYTRLFPHRKIDHLERKNMSSGAGVQSAECANFRVFFSGVLSPSVHASGHRNYASQIIGRLSG